MIASFALKKDNRVAFAFFCREGLLWVMRYDGWNKQEVKGKGNRGPRGGRGNGNRK